MFCLTTCNEASPPMPTCQNLRIPTCGRPAAEENQEGSRGRQSYALYIYTVFLYGSAGTKKATRSSTSFISGACYLTDAGCVIAKNRLHMHVLRDFWTWQRTFWKTDAATIA